LSAEVLSLDFTGTIVTMDMIDHFWNEAIPRHYAEENGVPVDRAKEKIQREYDEIGPRDLKWYLPKYWLDRFGLKVSMDVLLEESWHMVKVYRDAEKALPILTKNYKVIIVSNASKEFIEFFLKKKGFKIYKVFSTVSDLGVLSKLPQVYKYISKELKTESILHVGDDFVQDYLNPRMAGLNSLLLNREASESREKDVITSLEELLVTL